MLQIYAYACIETFTFFFFKQYCNHIKWFKWQNKRSKIHSFKSRKLYKKIIKVLYYAPYSIIDQFHQTCFLGLPVNKKIRLLIIFLILHFGRITQFWLKKSIRKNYLSAKRYNKKGLVLPMLGKFIRSLNCSFCEHLSKSHLASSELLSCVSHLWSKFSKKL